MPEPLISNVSDTARWMAAYRAAESARHDALFNDPFAERLAGERGHAIAAAAPRLTRNGWWWVTRTKLTAREVVVLSGFRLQRPDLGATDLATSGFRLRVATGVRTARGEQC